MRRVHSWNAVVRQNSRACKHLRKAIKDSADRIYNNTRTVQNVIRYVNATPHKEMSRSQRRHQRLCRAVSSEMLRSWDVAAASQVEVDELSRELRVKFAAERRLENILQETVDKVTHGPFETQQAINKIMGRHDGRPEYKKVQDKLLGDMV